MKKYLFALWLVLAFFMCSERASAQSHKNMRLQFVYIDHELSTPVSTVIRRMKERYDEVEEFSERESLVVYLSNGRFSPIAFVNLKEYADYESLRELSPTGTPRDTRDAFDYLLEALNNTNSHSVDARTDVNNILEIIDGLEVFANDGTLNFKSLTFDFYVGPTFWAQRNNEKVIARLYAVLQQGSNDPNIITFNVFKPKDLKLDYPEGKPYGEHNLNNINSTFKILDY